MHRDVATLLSQSSIRKAGMFLKKKFYLCYTGKNALTVQSRKKKKDV